MNFLHLKKKIVNSLPIVMPTTQDMQPCNIGLAKALLNLGLQNFLPYHKIQN
jgi:hypothetical protein